MMWTMLAVFAASTPVERLFSSGGSLMRLLTSRGGTVASLLTLRPICSHLNFKKQIGVFEKDVLRGNEDAPKRFS